MITASMICTQTKTISVPLSQLVFHSHCACVPPAIPSVPLPPPPFLPLDLSMTGIKIDV